jgi:protein involved in sex pheromone biosynthesis
MNKFAVSATIAAVMMMSGCATVFNDKSQTVNVKSSNGQTVKGVVDGVPFQTPGAVAVLRTKNAKVFNVEAEGCAKQTTLESKVDVKFFGNILLGGLFGSTTDYSTDKMWKYEDNVTISCNT